MISSIASRSSERPCCGFSRADPTPACKLAVAPQVQRQDAEARLIGGLVVVGLDTDLNLVAHGLFRYAAFDIMSRTERRARHRLACAVALAGETVSPWSLKRPGGLPWRLERQKVEMSLLRLSPLPLRVRERGLVLDLTIPKN